MLASLLYTHMEPDSYPISNLPFCEYFVRLSLTCFFCFIHSPVMKGMTLTVAMPFLSLETLKKVWFFCSFIDMCHLRRPQGYRLIHVLTSNNLSSLQNQNILADDSSFLSRTHKFESLSTHHCWAFNKSFVFSLVVCS